MRRRGASGTQLPRCKRHLSDEHSGSRPFGGYEFLTQPEIYQNELTVRPLPTHAAAKKEEDLILGVRRPAGAWLAEAREWVASGSPPVVHLAPSPPVGWSGSSTAPTILVDNVRHEPGDSWIRPHVEVGP